MDNVQFKLKQLNKPFRITGRGWGIPVSPEEPIPEKDLLGSRVQVGNHIYTVKGVEWWAIQRPEFWMQTDKFAILVEEIFDE
jgi:hypothetical protein